MVALLDGGAISDWVRKREPNLNEVDLVLLEGVEYGECVISSRVSGGKKN
jgi:hypothetical protein